MSNKDLLNSMINYMPWNKLGDKLKNLTLLEKEMVCSIILNVQETGKPLSEYIDGLKKYLNIYDEDGLQEIEYLAMAGDFVTDMLKEISTWKEQNIEKFDFIVHPEGCALCKAIEKGGSPLSFDPKYNGGSPNVVFKGNPYSIQEVLSIGLPHLGCTDCWTATCELSDSEMESTMGRMDELSLQYRGICKSDIDNIIEKYRFDPEKRECLKFYCFELKKLGLDKREIARKLNLGMEEVESTFQDYYQGGYELLERAENILKSIDGASNDITIFSKVLEMLTSAFKYHISENTQARIHRIKGEIYKRCNDKAKAIEHFESALRLNPKIGVRKVLTDLKSSTKK